METNESNESIQKHLELIRNGNFNDTIQFLCTVNEFMSKISSNNLHFQLVQNFRDENENNEQAKELLLMLIDQGQKAFVMKKGKFIPEKWCNSKENNFKKGTLLNCILSGYHDTNNKKLVAKLIDVGGKDIVLAKDSCGENPLHSALESGASTDVVMKLIDVGGKDIVIDKEDISSENALHFALKYKASNEVLMKLIDVGGRDTIIEKNTSNGSNSLHFALEFSSSTDVIIRLIDIGGRQLVVQRNNRDENSLHFATLSSVKKEVLMKIIDVGGKGLLLSRLNPLHNVLKGGDIDRVRKLIEYGGSELVLRKKNEFKQNSLHIALQKKGVSMDVVRKLISYGGKKLIHQQDIFGFNPLRYALKHNASSTKLITKLIDIGGKETLLAKDRNFRNALCFVLYHLREYIPKSDVLLKLIEIGGRELVLEKGRNDKKNSLHYLLECTDVSIDVVKKLIEVGGGRRFVLETSDDDLNSSLHYACCSNCSTEVIMYLIEIAGARFTLQQNLNNELPIHRLIKYKNCEPRKVALMIIQGIKVGGEFGIGGLFNCANDLLQQEIYDEWDDIVIPALQQVTSSLYVPPILHAAIIKQAPKQIITSIIEHIGCTVAIKDSMGRYPIDAAFELKHEWDDSTQEVVRAFSSLKRSTIIGVCARHGLLWENGMRHVLKEENLQDLQKQDMTTGLYPFMLAAMGDCNGLSSIYHLIRHAPSAVKPYDISMNTSSMMQKRERLSSVYDEDEESSKRMKYWYFSAGTDEQAFI